MGQTLRKRARESRVYIVSGNRDNDIEDQRICVQKEGIMSQGDHQLDERGVDSEGKIVDQQGGDLFDVNIETCLIQQHTNMAKMRRRVELAEEVITSSIAYTNKVSLQSIHDAKHIPVFTMNVSYTMDTEMRNMYNSSITTQQANEGLQANIHQIEDILVLRNRLLDLTNENYTRHVFDHASPVLLQEARNKLTH